jgi:hypothetical protein
MCTASCPSFSLLYKWLQGVYGGGGGLSSLSLESTKHDCRYVGFVFWYLMDIRLLLDVEYEDIVVRSVTEGRAFSKISV